MRNLTLALACLLTAPLVTPATAQTSSREWSVLLATEADRVDIDRATMTTVGPIRRVWLRWQYATSTDEAQFRIEQHEVDCALRRDRILAARRIERDRYGRDRVLDTLPAPAEGGWSTPSSGSLAGQLINAVCNSGRAGA